MASSAPLQLNPNTTSKPLPGINATRANFQHIDAKDGDNTPASRLQFQWTSRNNRKGRHALAVESNDAASSTYDVPAYSTSVAHISKVIFLMITYYPVWDVSWLVAYVFTLGSVVWVINAFLVFLPQLYNVPNADNLVYYGGGITAFIGATIFEVGSVLLMLEAFNASRAGCFGWALEKALTAEEKAIIRAVPDDDKCIHHHVDRSNLVSSSDPPDYAWSWWPTSTEFRQHLLFDLGFIASCAQMAGATIFWISGFTALPGIYDNLSPGALVGAYWIVQIVGGSFFIISGALFMLETQRNLWTPAWGTLGWHIGFWNCIGGLGFTLCPAFGLDSAGWAQYQSACSTFWGSWAFLLGSVIQWYESLDKHPVHKVD